MPRVWFVVFALSTMAALPGWEDAQAHFALQKDAFNISNAPGYCFAMAAFSRWYYLSNPGGPCLREVLDSKRQQAIAKQLQRFYSKHLVGIQANYCNRYHGNQNESFQRFVTGLTLGEPRLVLLMNRNSRGVVLHAVLAYEWIPEQQMLKVYDPNYPDEERLIDLERREYTSLDITYHAICFPEVLHAHEGLVKKMKALYNRYASKNATASARVVRVESH
jgi:hypothetical protein